MTSELAHTTATDWDNVTPGVWYGCLVITRTLCPHATDTYACEECSESVYGTETSYVDTYSNVREFAPDVDALCPEGWRSCEATLLLTSHGKYVMRYESWAWDEQMGPEGTELMTQDEYWAELESVDL